MPLTMWQIHNQNFNNRYTHVGIPTISITGDKFLSFLGSRILQNERCLKIILKVWHSVPHIFWCQLVFKKDPSTTLQFVMQQTFLNTSLWNRPLYIFYPGTHFSATSCLSFAKKNFISKAKKMIFIDLWNTVSHAILCLFKVNQKWKVVTKNKRWII